MRGLGSLCLPGDSFPYLVLLFVEQDRKDNRRADQGGDRVDRQGALEARRTGDQVADQRQRGAGQERRGHQHPVVGSLEQRTAEVRHGQSEEIDRSAIGGDDSRQDACRADDREAGPLDVEPQVAGVVLAQQEQVQCLYQQEGEGQEREHDAGEERHLVARDTGETAEAPNDVGPDVLLDAEILEHADDGARHVADHHADDEERDVALHLLRDEGDKGHDRQGADDGGDGERELAHIAQPTEGDATNTARQQDDEGHTQARSRADAEHRRARQRIAEDGLHLKTADREAGARHHRRDGLRHPRFPDDVGPDVAFRARAPKDMPDGGEGNMDGTEDEIQQEEEQNTRREQEHVEAGRSVHLVIKVIVCNRQVGNRATGRDGKP